GSTHGSPRRSHTLLRSAAGHRLDGLAVARRGSGATAAWIESFYDRRGGYRSEVRAAGFGAKPPVPTLSSRRLAAGLGFAGTAAGAQAAAWSSCTGAGSCTVHAATRGPRARFGHSISLGSIDASQSPAVAVGPRGQVIVGWVRSGHPVAAVGSAAGGRFGHRRGLSARPFALDLAVAFGPRRAPLVVWAPGARNPRPA